MKLKLAFLAAVAVASVLPTTAQTPAAPSPTPVPVPKIAEQLEQTLTLAAGRGPASRQDREQAYAKLLEGQRYLWKFDRVRSRSARLDSARLARESFRRSVELDPMLSEGYIALAELAINGQSQDMEEAIRLASLGARVNPNSFGARRLLARLYTFQTRLSATSLDRLAASKAITEWNNVTRLDPRNAEAWAFLSDLYERLGKLDEAVDALRKWLSAAVPADAGFYQRMTGGQSLAPETAALKLGAALLKAGRVREAIETLSAMVADDADNTSAVDLLREAIESADPATAALAIESLRWAVSANPSNLSLLNLLAGVQANAGKIDEAAAMLRSAAEKLLPSDSATAALLYVTLGDVYRRADKIELAVSAYEAALNASGVDRLATAAESEQRFAQEVFEKIIQALKAAERFGEAKTVIDRAQKLLGAENTFADRQAISLLRETGERQAAILRLRALKQRQTGDHSLLRLEATLLTEIGRVDEAVALIRKDMEKLKPGPPVATPSPGSGESITIAVPPSDTFSNYLFISSLYSQANRGKEAVEAANQAYAVARGSERKQIARLTLATAQQMAGDFKAAETTLRELLKETPGNPIALNNLGYFLLERDTAIREAFDLIEQAVKIDPTNPSYLDSLGWAYYKLGKFSDAEKYLKDALRYDSSSGTIHEHLGDVFQKQGNMGLARGSWNRAASLFSDAADVARVKKKLAGK